MLNILHLKYAVEIEKSHSISKAAENLYMGQPNLSRAVKELETALGAEIFKRTPHGMEVTPQGEKFLQYAKRILREIDELEEMFGDEYEDKLTFSISVPRASYISYAFSQFAKILDSSKQCELFYKETNSMRAINNIINADYRLGIIRYASGYSKYFKEMHDEKGLAYEMIAEFSYVLVMSESHPLAKKEKIDFDDLAPYTEIAHADPFVPSLPFAAVKKEELPDNVGRRIFIFERASQLELLETVPGTFMWVSPTPEDLLKKYGLVQRRCECNSKIYRDVLIFKKDYKLTETDNMFVTEVCKAKREYLNKT